MEVVVGLTAWDEPTFFAFRTFDDQDVICMIHTGVQDRTGKYDSIVIDVLSCVTSDKRVDVSCGDPSRIQVECHSYLLNLIETSQSMRVMWLSESVSGPLMIIDLM